MENMILVLKMMLNKEGAHIIVPVYFSLKEAYS